MFYYLGAKNRLAKEYPAPLYNTIIEPFAGSAAYAQFWRRTPTGLRKVILIEKDPYVVKVWHALQEMSSEEILALSAPEAGTYCNDFLLDALVKLCAHSNGPLHMISPLKVPTRVTKIWDGMIRRMAARVDEVRDWDIRCDDYTKAPNRVATWFIDPPYRPSAAPLNKTANPRGQGYKFGADQIDYDRLIEWVLRRRGQVICADHGETWVGGLVDRAERLGLRGSDGNHVHVQALRAYDSQGFPNRETCVDLVKRVRT